MDTAHWPQEIVVKPIEEIVTNTCPKPGGKISSRSTTTTTTKEQQILNCPRCNSTNTKFCYYNNYSLTQPRYFCKTCRRYWTEGGSLRNIPVGGGSRKNKRSSSSSSSSNNNNNNINYSSSNNSSSIISSISSLNSNKKLPDLITPPSSNSSNSNQFQNPNQDLNLAFPSNNNGGPIRSFSELIQLPISTSGSGSSVAVAVSADQLQSQQMSALELLTGFSSRGLSSFLPSSMQIHHHHQDDPNSLGFQDFKLPSLNFSLDHHGNINGSSGGGGYGNSSMQENTSGGRLLFPFEDLKQQVSSNKNNINNGENEIEDHDQQNRDQQGDDHHSAGYWSGMLGGGVNGSW